MTLDVKALSRLSALSSRALAARPFYFRQVTEGTLLENCLFQQTRYKGPDKEVLQLTNPARSSAETHAADNPNPYP